MCDPFLRPASLQRIEPVHVERTTHEVLGLVLPSVEAGGTKDPCVEGHGQLGGRHWS